MSTVLTTAGKSLIARLQAGEKLVIDRFIFAYIPGLDPAEPMSPEAGLPENVVFEYTIPEAHRAYMGPDQVVYSAVLGSDVGDFSMNWQGLYCSQHQTLVAASSFHPVQKYALSNAEGEEGNNFTRNFILKFEDAREITGVNVEAEAWQMDYTLRLYGMDERERLSNRDIYGRASFLGDGWKLAGADGAYRLEPGMAYIEGIRAEQAEALALPENGLPCSVWLDVALEPLGSKMVTSIKPVFAGLNDELADYTSPEPVCARHYLEKIAEITADGSIADVRQRVLEESDVLSLVDGKIEWTRSNGLPLLSVLYDPSSLAKPGYLDASKDHGLLTRASFPEAAAEIQRRFEAGDTAVVTDEVWLTECEENGVCPKFSIGDGEITFRIPMLAGLYPGAPAEGQTAGQYLGDAIRNITGRTPNSSLWSNYGKGGKSGCITTSGKGGWSTGTGVQERAGILEFNAADSVPTAEVNRPRTAVMTPFIKMYGTVTQTSQANIAALIEATTRKQDEASAYKIRYESEWFDIAVNGVYSFEHGIQTDAPWRLMPIIVGRVKAAQVGWEPGDIIFADGSNYVGGAGSVELGWALSLSNDKVSAVFGNDASFITNSKNGGYGVLRKDNVECKLIIRG